MPLRLVTGPTSEPITRDEAKEFLRVDHNNDDELITSLITSARVHVEDYTSRALLTQTWELWLDQFPAMRKAEQDTWWDGVREGSISSLFRLSDQIVLKRIPVQAVTTFSIFDMTNFEKFLIPQNYYLDNVTEPNRITLAPGYSWPISMGLRWTNAIRIRFLAGYSSSRVDVPEDLKTGVKMVMAQLYDKRDEVFALDSAKEILTKYRLGVLQI